MRFQKLTIKNFKVFPKKTTIDFSSSKNEDKRNIVLIGGTNGAGKTTITEAVKLCLYGRQGLRWSRKKLFQLINEQQKANGNYELYIEVEFLTDKGEKLIIIRKWDTKGANLEPDYTELKQKQLVVEKGGRRRKVLNEREWNEFLDSKIPKGVSNFFFFDGEKIQEFAETGARSMLKESIETILGLATLRNLSRDLKKIKDRFRDKEEISDEEFEREQAERKVLEKKINKKSEQIKEIAEEIDKLKERKEQKVEKFKELFGENPSKKSEFEDLEREKTKLQNEKVRIEEKISEYIKGVFPFALLGRFFSKIKEQIDREEELKRNKALQEEKQEIAKRIVDDLFSDKCPIGGEPVTKTEKDDLIRNITDIITEDQPRDDSRDEEEPMLDLSEGQKSKLLGIISEIKRKAGKDLLPLIRKKKKVEQELKTTKNRLDSLKRKQDKEEFSRLQKEISNLDDNLGSKKEERRGLENERKELQEKLKKINSKIETLQNKLDRSRKAKGSIKLTKQIGVVIEDYIKRLRERKLSKLEENIFKMFQRLATKADLYSEINIDRDNYKVNIIDNTGKRKRKENLAAGEKEIYAISLLWGLARTSAYDLPVIIDTPLARLDKSHRDNIVQNYFPEAGDQVILLSTDSEIDKEYYRKLQPYIDKAVRLDFDKKRKWTTIEEGYFW